MHFVQIFRRKDRNSVQTGAVSKFDRFIVQLYQGFVQQNRRKRKSEMQIFFKIKSQQLDRKNWDSDY